MVRGVVRDGVTTAGILQAIFLRNKMKTTRRDFLAWLAAMPLIGCLFGGKVKAKVPRRLTPPFVLVSAEMPWETRSIIRIFCRVASYSDHYQVLYGLRKQYDLRTHASFSSPLADSLCPYFTKELSGDYLCSDYAVTRIAFPTKETGEFILFVQSTLAGEDSEGHKVPDPQWFTERFNRSMLYRCVDVLDVCGCVVESPYTLGCVRRAEEAMGTEWYLPYRWGDQVKAAAGVFAQYPAEGRAEPCWITQEVHDSDIEGYVHLDVSPTSGVSVAREDISRMQAHNEWIKRKIREASV